MPKFAKLPIGDSSFASIRTGGYVYVDKTRHIYRMIDEGKFYFMARPRRFGKSLTVSVLLNLFQGRRELFNGLWIAEHVKWKWQEYPVVVIDFNGISHDTSENLKLGLTSSLKNTGQLYNVQLKEVLLQELFNELIQALFDKTGMPIIVLVDEYDKPIIDHLGRGEDSLEIAKQNRDILKSFFGVLKGARIMSRLQFVFFTGVSKFSRVSIFSELNHLNDITMNAKFADMMGYTQNELETCFDDHIQEFSRQIAQKPEELRKSLERYYNGYRFTEKNIRVYNPFSVLKALDEKTFKNFWFETGTPTFLVNILKEKKYSIPKIENLQLDEQVFSTYNIEKLQPEALLFQTGYITIKDVSDYLYSFHYPNQEVKISFLKYLLFSYNPEKNAEMSLFSGLSQYLQNRDTDSFFETVQALFASIPFTLENKRDEAYFHTLFYLMVCASGINARSEVLTCDGRIDLVMEFKDLIYVIEFKCNQNAEIAIQQIREKSYDRQFKSTGKKIMLMGINFDTKKRNVVEWKVV